MMSGIGEEYCRDNIKECNFCTKIGYLMMVLQIDRQWKLLLLVNFCTFERRCWYTTVEEKFINDEPKTWAISKLCVVKIPYNCLSPNKGVEGGEPQTEWSFFHSADVGKVFDIVPIYCNQDFFLLYLNAQRALAGRIL